jgi:hypothetical protein
VEVAEIRDRETEKMIRANAYGTGGNHRGKFWERQPRLIAGIVFHL